MRFALSGFALAAILGLAACANNPNRPTDTGNMAYPAPQPAGVIGTARPGVDTGSMQPVAPSATREQSTIRAQPDTLGNMGSMQIPQSSQGNLRGRTTP